MKKFIIGTAGHIDHGKTTLIKALTGRSCDKLKEEIERGISINLGFTYFDLKGERFGIVDVPGHERFIKNMIAGAVGIDLCLLVISASEGVMPQTKEHIEILSHLNLSKGLVVVTKSSLIDEDLLDITLESIKDDLKDTFFYDKEIIAVDSLTGFGIDKLVDRLFELSKEVEEKPTHLPARLNIDRVFSLKGLGTIVTGTLSEGEIKVNDELFIYPQNQKVKVRNIQVHDSDVSVAYAGQRTAINLTGVKKEDVRRGNTLAPENSLVYTEIADAKITVAKDYSQIKMWDRLRVYVGTREVLARAVPINQKVISSGESGFCQLRFEKGVYVKKDDPFVLRLFSPLVTIGGGVILNVQASKHKDISEKDLKSLKSLEEDEVSSQVLETLYSHSSETMSIGKISTMLTMSKEDLEKDLNILIDSKNVVKINDFYLHIETFNDYVENTIIILNDFHLANPLKHGMNKEELRPKVKTPYKLKDFSVLLDLMIIDGILKEENGYYSNYSFEIKYNDNQQKIKDKILSELDNQRFAPCKITEIINMDKTAKEVIESLNGSEIIRLDKDVYILNKYIHASKELICDFLKDGEKKGISLADFRNLTDTSRKFSLLILDYLDSAKFTKRVEDLRILYK
ncbi:MAG: selenocysteine-specific translation elongation factor [Lachnospirales bacterium]